MIPESFIQELLNRVDIVNVVDRTVPLKKAGANYMACCPFHNEKSPSFTVSPTKQFYHCFGCGAHGTAVGFLMEHQGLSFVEAINELAKQVGMIVPQETRDNNETNQAYKKAMPGLQEAMQQASDYYRVELKKSQRAIEYLKGRGLSGQIAARFQMGYSPAGWQNLASVFSDYQSEMLKTSGLVIDNDQGRRYDRFRDRVMFPIHDQKGQIIGFGGRVLTTGADETAGVFPAGEAAEAARSSVNDGPKYLNSPETPLFQKGHELYGLYLARRAIRDAGRVLVVEGYMDVVALAQYGIEYAVAALGTATTPQHITKLMRQTDEIVFCFDGDSAGQRAAWRAAMNALPALTDGLRLSFLFLPKEHDPDSYVREFGKEAFEAAMQTAMPLSQYIIQYLSAENKLQSQEDKVQFLNEAEPILKQIQAPRLALLLRKRVAELADISMDEMSSMIKLPDLDRRPTKSAPRQTRTTVSLQRRFVLMLLMQPSLAEESDLGWVQGSAEEDVLVQVALKTALTYPQSNTGSLLRHLEGELDGRLVREIGRELAILDDSLDFALEFQGARKHLMDMYLQRDRSKLLDTLKEKPLSELTEQEKALLRF
ncbi:DNA primase [Methylovorus sp. MM2]|uniref:DNA primase n=1 Tax=Methylovorus sp. MM2 TaxID=1848038 RepID=UPI0007E09E1B|nr:DNA primase [Methylovorus sp. MM2]OAM52268.1 DNA primase [Methylovorus sp. MM2]